MKSRQWINFLKSPYLNLLSSALFILFLFPIVSSAVHLHCAIFMFFFCFCMSYAKIELFTQWNKNILFRPVFSVDVCLSCYKESDTSFSICILCTFSQGTFILSTSNVRGGFACVSAIADVQSVDVPGTGWVRVWALRRGNSLGREQIRQVCAAYVVTWCL